LQAKVYIIIYGNDHTCIVVYGWGYATE